jgi:rubrerythrin
MKFGEVLLEMGLITPHQLDVALREQEYNLKSVGYSETIGSILLRNGVITEEQHQNALMKYFQFLSEDEEQPSYVRETAKVALRAVSQQGENSLSEETKMIIIQKVNEYEEKINQFEKSINTLSKMEQKRVITETIEKEKKEIEKLISKIDILRNDLEKYS